MPHTPKERPPQQPLRGMRGGGQRYNGPATLLVYTHTQAQLTDTTLKKRGGTKQEKMTRLFVIRYLTWLLELNIDYVL